MRISLTNHRPRLSTLVTNFRRNSCFFWACNAVSGLALSAVVKRSIVIAGHKTSVSLEEPFWSVLKEIAKSRRTTLSALVHSIEHDRSDRQALNLSSAIRLFVLAYFREQKEGKDRQISSR